MDRRSFLKKSALGGSAAAATALAAPAYAQGQRTLTMVTSWGRGLAGVFDSAQRCADSINAMSDGSLNVEIKAAGELVGAFEVFDAVSSGQADMYHAADYYFVGQHPGYAFFTAVPFGMTAQELVNWYYHDGGMELHDELGEIFGLKSFLAGNTGAQAGGWYSKEINSPEDFNGLKFRMPGLGGKALGKLGASVQNIPGSEVYQALSSGAIDGTEWIGPWADEKAGFQEITKTYYTAGFHEPGAGLSLATNRDVFNELTPAQQKIIEIAAAEAHQWNLAQFLANNGAALQRLQAGGVKVLEFPDSVWDAFGQASQEVLDENMGDELFKKIHDSAMTSMAASSAWNNLSSGVYTAQRDRVRG
ncbi:MULTISPECIES: TRAP transporter substrate-binding protein [Ruegeria]|jgi:TRAP-type mannitol/chloroaromatic compound transport system substrate-binding protein|uniref:TRAP transporter substrate-binding protein n=1 Tax=Ruegeria TaxID=97050 RepID=UPI000E488399|nr:MULTISPECIES: TRAP transporter substrate-binding protein DctP [Ruegeria]AXT25773.1 twin-arginine translocation signal domain-containing protein [Ruegeria sp. AD91A]NOC44376.1 twin-arginine translocation signal domain-containing protein [Ruegeria sp. HKCCD7559]NOC90958.1 twin-arginine translocation signal domain-containing protein [Ruegeria sp. HKCCD6604]NOD83104.1 twin-arginine translocation signal domain-containing protein [Ruegeria sp. HKCCD6119]NOD95836.1 twin-arginine translocation sign